MHATAAELRPTMVTYDSIDDRRGVVLERWWVGYLLLFGYDSLWWCASPLHSSSYTLVLVTFHSAHGIMMTHLLTMVMSIYSTDVIPTVVTPNTLLMAVVIYTTRIRVVRYDGCYSSPV